MNDRVFYSIWRNCYLRSCIRNRVCRDLVINIKSLKELQENNQYLSLFTEQDKRDNNIIVRLIIQDSNELNRYSSSDYRHLVNDVRLNSMDVLDLNKIYRGVLVLSCRFNDTTRCIGTLHEGLVKLIVYGRGYDSFSNTALDDLVSNLPTSLRQLSLPTDYSINNRIVELPSTLEELDYSTNARKLKNIVIGPSNKLCKCYVYVESMDDLQVVQSKTWVSQISMIRLPIERITCGLIPSHIKELIITHDDEMEPGALPQSLVSLSYTSKSQITKELMPQHLKKLYLDTYKVQLKVGLLPSTLEFLYITSYNHPLLPDTLPTGLTYLDLQSFNQQLTLGALPQSLTVLSLPVFKHELKPFVLPPRLKKLSLQKFSGRITKNTLPNNLTHLQFNSFNGSFELAPQMNDLSFLVLYAVHRSVAQMIFNNEKITIHSHSIDQDLNLTDTSIKYLELKVYERTPLLSKFVPKQIKSLKLYNLYIKSNGLIPTSCVRLKSNSTKLDLDLIPSTTKFTTI